MLGLFAMHYFSFILPITKFPETFIVFLLTLQYFNSSPSFYSESLLVFINQSKKINKWQGFIITFKAVNQIISEVAYNY